MELKKLLPLLEDEIIKEIEDIIQTINNYNGILSEYIEGVNSSSLILNKARLKKAVLDGASLCHDDDNNLENFHHEYCITNKKCTYFQYNECNCEYKF